MRTGCQPVGAYLYINLLPSLEAAQGFVNDGRQR